jgi:hypothetical protein
MATRTTLTFDPDVAKAIERRRRVGGRTLKEDVNDLLRLGLAAEAAQLGEPSRPRFQVKPLSLGRQLFPIDDVEAALDFAEGPDRR